MARSLAVLWLGLLVAFGTPAIAAPAWQNVADPVFVRPDVRELPEAAAMSLAEDSFGFLWVGTQSGLARYDGLHFRSFLPNPNDPRGLPDGYIRALLPSTGGDLWIGSSSDGLVHYDAASESFRTWRPDPAGRRGPRSASIDAIVAAGAGRLWVGGDGGLDAFDPRRNAFAPATLDAGMQPAVWSILLDRAGAVWIGTQQGLYVRDAGALRFRRFPLRGAVRTAAQPVYSLYEDAAGRLWAGSVNTVFEIDPTRSSVGVVSAMPQSGDSLAPGQQWAITEMTPGVLWVGTDSAISIVDATTHRVHRVETDLKDPGGLPGGRVVQFLRDRSGLVWLADHVGGLLLYNPTSRGLYELSGSAPRIGFGDQGMPAVAAAPGGLLWAGGFEGRIAAFDPQRGRVRTLTVPNRAAVQTLLVDRAGTLWIGTTDGLCLLRTVDAAPACPARPAPLAGASIYALLDDGARLWVGGSDGLWVEDKATARVTPFPPAGSRATFSNTQVRALLRDDRGRLWVGTESGLNRIERGGRIVRYAFSPYDPNAIGPGGVTSLFEDRRGRLWVGMEGGPLDVLQATGGAFRVRKLARADGMPNENVDGLAADRQGRIWASTENGIALIDPKTLRARGLGFADGVSEGAYWAGAVTQSADGTTFFGGLTGIAIVAPHAASPWTYAPPIVVAALDVGRRSIPAGGVNAGDAVLELPADARDVSVEFAALDYSAPRGLRYQYRLRGYDRDWVDADVQHRIATYSRLAPGDYTLDVRSTNRIGVWSSRVLRVGLRAAPAWYETWWFRVLAGALVLCGAYLLHLVRTAVLRRRQDELERIVQQRTRELSEANAKLQELSLSDPLTGLHNRRFLTEHLESDIALTLRRYVDWLSAPGSTPPLDADMLFFLVDLDHFKEINDRFGHHAGDALLMQMRARLHEVFRDSDFVVRWGGDEFLAVARGSRRTDAGMIAERMRESIASRPFALDGAHVVSLTVSVGFAAFPFVPTRPGTLSSQETIALADRGLYLAKEAGRNTWVGLAATAGTDPALLARGETLGADLVRMAALDVLMREPARRERRSP